MFSKLLPPSDGFDAAEPKRLPNAGGGAAGVVDPFSADRDLPNLIGVLWFQVLLPVPCVSFSTVSAFSVASLGLAKWLNRLLPDAAGVVLDPNKFETGAFAGVCDEKIEELSVVCAGALEMRSNRLLPLSAEDFVA